MSPWLLLAIAAFFQACLVSVALIPLVRRAAGSMGLIDAPTLARKHHERPIPRSGGIAIFFAFWGCLWLDIALAKYAVPGLGAIPEEIKTLAGNVQQKLPQLTGVFAGSLTIFVLGALDDRLNLRPSSRLVVQILACIPLLMTGTVLKLFLPVAIAWPLTVIWLVALTNSFNFLDNMNGLTSGVAIIISLVLGVLAALSREWYMLAIFAMVAGAALGFWFYNFPKASIFLGDSGSTHLGFFIGAMTILSTYYQAGAPTKLPVLIPLIILGVPLFDTASVMWIRWRMGKPFMEGDTNHLSHRLVALGMSRVEAVLFIYAIALVAGLLAIPLRELDTQHGIIQAVSIFLIFFLLHRLERVSYRRRQSADSP
ncbi:MraY family glycosyltransferase [soil metagenome]